jgi:hypothetical protein
LRKRYKGDDKVGSLFGSKQKSTTKSEPFTGKAKDWAYAAQPKLWESMNTPTAKYEGELSTGLSDTQKSAMGGLSSLINTQALTDTIGGKYLNPDSNPYLSQYYDQAASKVRSSLADSNDYVNGQFNQRGLYNSSARQESLQKQTDKANDTLADVATGIYGNAYTTERSNQMNAINQQGNLINSQFSQGTTQQGIDQTALDKEYQEYLRQQGMDQQSIDNYLNYLNTIKNPSQTTTQSSGGLGGLLGTIGGIGLSNSNFGKKW